MLGGLLLALSRSVMAKSSRARSLCCAVAVAVVLGSYPARAERGTGLDGSLGGQSDWMPYVPTLSVPTTETSSRTVRGGTLPSIGSLYFAGLQIDSSFVYRGRLVVPLLGVSGALAVGNSPAVLSSFDGSIAEERPWTAYRLECLLPGLGVRFTARRWTLGASIRAYVVGFGMDATIAAGGGSSDLSMPSRFGLGARADVEGCRRLDPMNRICAFIAPSIYEFGLFNGGSAGLRWELGP
jgi:hypothetical protein